MTGMPSNWINRVLEMLQDVLARFGVAEASRPVGALVLLYLLVTLAVLVFVWVIWRMNRKPTPPAAVGEKPEAGAEEEMPRSRPPAPERPTAEREAEEAPAETVLDRMRTGLGRTRESLVGRLERLFQAQSGFSQDLADELEEILITSDFGMPTTTALIESLQKRFAGSAATSEEIYAALKQEIADRLRAASDTANVPSASPLVVLVVGVNGVGKTTTIGKLASRFRDEGKEVLLGAGDTFRAAAADQLEIWSERAGADLVRHQQGGDPAAVAYDAVRAAIARKKDVLILDTAGRLHTKANLMDELKKVRRVLGRELAGAPHQTLLVVDATTGQNALAQARLFSEAVHVDGIVLTKLDGTAKGGIVVAISSDLGIPVRYIGVGEAVGDLRPFDPDLFVQALFGAGNDA